MRLVTVMGLMTTLAWSALVATAATMSAGDNVTDNTLRYVNAQIITVGDVSSRYQEHIAELTRAGRPLPKTTADAVTLAAQFLERITDENLLVQEAKRLGVVVDRSRIARQVLDEARQTGRGQSLTEQARRAQTLLREAEIDAAVGYYTDRVHPPESEEIAHSYADNVKLFVRPARADVAVFVLRPTAVGEVKADKEAGFALLAAARALDDVGLRSAAATASQQIIAIDDPGEQQRILRAWIAAVTAEMLSPGVPTATATAPAAVERTPADTRWLSQAMLLQERLTAQRSAEQCSNLIADLRTTLLALPEGARSEAMSMHVRASSQGPNAIGGGILERVEPGVQGVGFDAAVFSATTAAVVGPFANGDALWLVHVRHLEPTRQRPLPEVASDIEARLKQDRPNVVRAKVVAILRQRALISDRMTIAEIFK